MPSKTNLNFNVLVDFYKISGLTQT